MPTQRFVSPARSNSATPKASQLSTVPTHRTLRAVTTAAALVLGAVALPACSQESYYCDATGCFRCDGVGCREVTPATREPCACNDPCTVMTTTCTALGCTRACTSDTDCGDTGTTCQGGFCISPVPGREVAAAIDCSCSATRPCTDDGLICRDGACVIGCETTEDCCAPTDPPTACTRACVDGMCVPTVTPECSATAPCAAPLECVDGECRAPEATCQFSSECGARRICVDRRCTVGCDATTPCPTGSVCTDGFCREELPPPGGCTVNADCNGGRACDPAVESCRICRDTRCLDECAVDMDCGAGRYCLEGRCRYDDVPAPSCGAGASTCTAPSVCRNGTCRVPCTTSTECPLFDVQYTVCLRTMPTDAMGVCSTTNEATSNCMASADCDAGQECIDGICR